MIKHTYFPANPIFIIACLFFCSGCSKKIVPQSTSNSFGAEDGAQQRLQQECRDAARNLLGNGAEIVKYGSFNNPNVQEAVAVVHTEHSPHRGGELDVSRLIILRHERTGWRVALTAGKEVNNEAGFIGIDYIDDSMSFWGYRVLFLDQRDDGKKAFALSLGYLSKDGNTEGIPLEISWDESVGRYREFDTNSDPAGFKRELKKPPHIMPRVSPGH